MLLAQLVQQGTVPGQGTVGRLALGCHARDQVPACIIMGHMHTGIYNNGTIYMVHNGNV